MGLRRVVSVSQLFYMKCNGILSLAFLKSFNDFLHCGLYDSIDAVIEEIER